MKIKIFQFKDGYRYNSDSIFLINFIKNNFNLKGEILEVGAGSGVISIVLSKFFLNTKFHLLEIQEQNLKLLHKNLSENLLDYPIIHTNFLDYKEYDKFDFVISNPPFYHDGVKKSENLHKFISRYDVNLPFDKFVKNSSLCLKNRGYLIFAYASSELPKVLSTLLSNNFAVEFMQFIYPKIGRGGRLVLIGARYNSKSKCKILDPIIVFDGDKYSKEAQDIFDNIKLVSKDYV